MSVRTFEPFDRAEKALQGIAAGRCSAFVDLYRAAQSIAATTKSVPAVAEPLLRILEKLVKEPTFQAESVALALTTMSNIALFDGNDYGKGWTPNYTKVRDKLGQFTLKNIDKLPTPAKRLHGALAVSHISTVKRRQVKRVIEKIVMQMPEEWQPIFALTSLFEYSPVQPSENRRNAFRQWAERHESDDVLPGVRVQPSSGLPSERAIKAFARTFG